MQLDFIIIFIPRGRRTASSFSRFRIGVGAFRRVNSALSETKAGREGSRRHYATCEVCTGRDDRQRPLPR